MKATSTGDAGKMACKYVINYILEIAGLKAKPNAITVIGMDTLPRIAAVRRLLNM